MAETISPELKAKLQEVLNKSAELFKEAEALQHENAQLKEALDGANRVKTASADKIQQLIPDIITNLTRNGWVSADVDSMNKTAEYLSDPTDTMVLLKALSTRVPMDDSIRYSMGEPSTKTASANTAPDSENTYSEADLAYFRGFNINV